MTDQPQNPFEKVRQVALYREALHGWYSIFEYLGDKDGQYHTSYLRISAPVEVRFTALESDEAVRAAVASLDAAEQQLVNKFQENLRQIRSQKANLLALTHQPSEVKG